MFLSPENRQIIEHETREVKKDEKHRYRDTKGRWQTVVTRQAGTIKRVKRNRSRDGFRMRLGMATVLEQSGDKTIEKGAGSAIVKKALWQYVNAAIEPTKLANGKPRPPITEDARILTDARDEFLKQKDLSGKHRASKLASKFANLLYKEFVAVFCR
ncbi:MAG: hypothetical protein AAGA60_27055 [Cyanobacteria bacterium P01_E01_bin.42]